MSDVFIVSAARTPIGKQMIFIEKWCNNNSFPKN